MNKKIVIDKNSLKEIIKDTVKETMLKIATSNNKKNIEFLEDALLIAFTNNKCEEYINDKKNNSSYI